jgi:small subunit ribosomal protein S6
MKNYELTFLIEDEKTVADLEKVLTQFKGKKEEEKPWGKRTLAYPINKKTSALYYTWKISLSPEMVKDFETKLQYDNVLLRYLLTSIDN